MSRPNPAAADLTTEGLLAALRAGHLLSEKRLRWFEARQIHHPQAPRSLLRELTERGWLTEFQATQVLAGRLARLVLGNYRILDRLGSGGMGQVYRAEHRWMRRAVALKILSGQLFDPILTSPCAAVGTPPSRGRDCSLTPTQWEGSLLEIRAAGQLKHPHIVTSYDAGRIGSVYFLVMEYVEGVDLEQLVRTVGPLPVALACNFVRQTALGLKYLHERGYVHRDIKPTNLLLEGVHVYLGKPLPTFADRGVIKILDLGLARPASPRHENGIPPSPSSHSCTLWGTPDYLPPEVAENSQSIDIRGDLYSLGCTFYYLLTGQVPYPGGSWTEKLLRHRLDTLTPPETFRPEIPAEVANIVLRLLDKEPADRFATPADLIAALDDAIGASRARRRRGSVNPMLSRFRSRSLRATLFGVILAVLLGAGLGLLVRQSRWLRDGTSSTNSHPLTLTHAGQPLARTEQASLPFRVQNSTRDCASLTEAIAAARDGDTVVIHGQGPFVTEPLRLLGKSLTLQAAPGCRPRVVFAPAESPSPQQALITCDRALTIEGLDLVYPAEASSLSASPAGHLLWCEQSSICLRNCQVHASGRSAPIVCRRCSSVSLSNCQILAAASALWIEAGDDPENELTLSYCTIAVEMPDRAAVALWASEASRPGNWHLRLDRNRFHAGRVVALTSLPSLVEVTARNNEFTFRDALVAYAGATARDWHKSTVWHGQDNVFRSAGDWLSLDEHPAEVRGLDAWRRCWDDEEFGSSEETFAHDSVSQARTP
jgi:serine/threonine-protein kinase